MAPAARQAACTPRAGYAGKVDPDPKKRALLKRARPLPRPGPAPTGTPEGRLGLKKPADNPAC